MAGVKALAKDTAIYGASSIIGRFLNWCLVPLYTIQFAAAEYGVVTYVYSIVALALIILTYGMETGFFRFANHDDYAEDSTLVYSTALISLASTSTIFMALVLAFLGPVSRALECEGHPSYIAMMTVAVAVDAFTAIPFSYLRYRHAPVRFATLKVVSIILNIGLNLFWILLCPWLNEQAPGCVDWCWSPTVGIGYIFLANLVSSTAVLLLMYPELHGFKWRFDASLWRRMLRYSWPLLVLGVAGIMNQTVDKILFPILYANPDEAMRQLGIYGANYKIAIVMVMFIQAFRFAYEPFIFARGKGGKSGGRDRYQEYRDAMKWFVIAAMFIFLVVMFYLDILRYFISPRYFAGLKVVPVIMVAEFFFGVFFNLSLWYKLTDRTIWGMWFSLGGLAITLALNILLVPRFGYMGCAWAALACYGSMMVASYIAGRIKHPIGYNVPRLTAYFLGAMALWGVAILLTTGNHLIDMLLTRPLLLLLYLLAVLRVEGIRIRRMRRVACVLILLMALTPMMADRTTLRGRPVAPESLPVADSQPDSDTIPLSDGDITVFGYDKPLRATREAFFITNNTPDTVRALELSLQYFDLQRLPLHDRTVWLRTDLLPGATRRFDIPAWDRQCVYYYRHNARPRRSDAVPYDVVVSPLHAIIPSHESLQEQ